MSLIGSPAITSFPCCFVVNSKLTLVSFSEASDENGSEYTNVVVDASDVFHCK
jgi:hypothetical protein